MNHTSRYVALVVCVIFVACEQCANQQQKALQSILPQIDTGLASNLVREANIGIGLALSRATTDPFYNPSADETPVAYSIHPMGESNIGSNMGNSVFIQLQGSNAPCMVVKIPVHYRGFCWWQVLISVKPGAGFAKNSRSHLINGARG
jgi:hypothetical protein